MRIRQTEWQFENDLVVVLSWNAAAACHLSYLIASKVEGGTAGSHVRSIRLGRQAQRCFRIRSEVSGSGFVESPAAFWAAAESKHHSIILAPHSTPPTRGLRTISA